MSFGVQSNPAAATPGALIVNADDWGRNSENTDRALECLGNGSVSSVSAMVFMEDSRRAAMVAREAGIDAGLHLNFTTPFSSPNCPARLLEHQQRVARYLRSTPLTQVIYHPGLAGSFEYLIAAQREEFRQLYGAEPDRVDGHHHMHLCANVLLAKLLPAGTIVRRNFTFAEGEKNWANRLYRTWVDRMLAKRHRLTDFFFSLPPLEPGERLTRIFAAARESVVELETHPINPTERQFLAGGEIFHWISAAQIRSFCSVNLAPVCANRNGRSA